MYFIYLLFLVNVNQFYKITIVPNFGTFLHFLSYELYITRVLHLMLRTSKGNFHISRSFYSGKLTPTKS